MSFRSMSLAAVAVFVLVQSAFAADPAFTAQLRGDRAPTETGSKATGAARLVVHTDTRTVDVSLTVSGIAMDNFAEHLAHAPVGPMHLHLYEANGNVSLLLPFPLDANYAATANGFSYARSGYSYAEGAKILNSTVSFDGFVDALKSGAVVFNVHTDAFKDGEISGTMTASK